jgi:NADH-quinone oxidoreductase subunit C
MTHEQTVALLQARLGDTPTGSWPALALTVPRDRWVEAARVAKQELGCNFFAFLTAIDWKNEGLDVVTRLENLDVPFSVTLRTRLPNDDDTCPSLTPLYRGADWMEREAFDMFGIRFDGHPDLRRILLPDDWQGHPLRKSYDIDTPYPPYR